MPAEQSAGHSFADVVASGRQPALAPRWPLPLRPVHPPVCWQLCERASTSFESDNKQTSGCYSQHTGARMRLARPTWPEKAKQWSSPVVVAGERRRRPQQQHSQQLHRTHWIRTASDKLSVILSISILSRRSKSGRRSAKIIIIIIITVAGAVVVAVISLQLPLLNLLPVRHSASCSSPENTRLQP